jgi:ribonuclease R
LADDYYYLEGETHTLVGRQSGRRYRLGDRIEVTIARVDVDRRELSLVPADVPGAVAPPTSPRPPRVRSASPKPIGRPKPEGGGAGRGKKKGRGRRK